MNFQASEDILPPIFYSMPISFLSHVSFLFSVIISLNIFRMLCCLRSSLAWYNFLMLSSSTVHSGCILVVSLWLFLFSFGRIWTEYKLLQTKSSGLSRSQCHCILWYLELPILYSVCWSMIDFKPLVPWCHVYTGICFYTVEIIF